MIFRSITVENLFCYRGEQVLDLTRPAETPAERNVALVIGRNGYGKTSLLNAIKLLFLGTETKKQRQVGFPPLNLQRNEYILGKPGRWLGIRNRSASRDGAENCRVCVELDAGGRTIKLERSFTFSRNGAFENEILRYVNDDGEVFSDSAAQERLEELLPPELVPFFFFDGEEIQQLAEAPDADRQAAMERLLRLRFLTGVEEEVGQLVRQWLRAELPEGVRGEIAKHEADIIKHEAEITRLEAKNRQLGIEESQLTRDVEGLARRMEGLRARGAVAASAALEREIQDLSRSLEERQSALAPEIAADAPLLVAPGLIAAGIASLADLVDRKAQSKKASFGELFAQVPARLFDEPPHPMTAIPPHVKNFYKKKLDNMLGAAAVEDDGPPHLLESLDLPRARQLLEKLTTLRATGSSLRQTRAQGLREVSRAGGRLQKLKEELRRAEFSEPEVAAELDKLQLQRDAQIKRSGEIAQECKSHTMKLDELAAQIKSCQKSISILERQVREAQIGKRRLDIAIVLQKTFFEYRRIQRQTKRFEIENLVNEHFACLMTGHRLAAKIKIDEELHMRIHARDETEIGMSTMSHGMRQLAMTALLWTLKDLAKHHPLPVVVDTPLARIDRQNQHNLLKQYYPNAARQVILLATDSEIDHSKYDALRPHLYRQTLLHNPTGERAEFESRPVDDGLATE